MTGHGARVAEAQVDVVVAVGARRVGAGRRLEEQRERPGPLDHPVHGHAVEQALAGVRVERAGPGMPVREDRRARARAAPGRARARRRSGRSPGWSVVTAASVTAARVSRRSVEPAGVAADGADGEAALRMQLEEARAAVGAAVELGGHRAPAHPANRGGSSDDGRMVGTRKHVVVRSFLGRGSGRCGPWPSVAVARRGWGDRALFSACWTREPVVPGRSML